MHAVRQHVEAYIPAGQRVLVLDPDDEVYEPAGTEVHAVDAIEEYFPAMHKKYPLAPVVALE